MADLPPFVDSLVRAIRARPARETPNQELSGWITAEMPADLSVLLDAIARHGPDSASKYPGWSFFEKWDFTFWLSRYPDGLIQLGTDAGGAPFAVSVEDGKATVVDVMDERAAVGTINGWLGQMFMRKGDVLDPALENFRPPGDPPDWG